MLPRSRRSLERHPHSLRASRAPRAQNMALESLEPRALLAAGPVIDDRFEPNNKPRVVVRAPEGVASSPNIGLVQNNKSVTNLKLMDRTDYYRVRFSGPGSLGDFVRISFLNRRGNLDLRLMSANGRNIVAESVTDKNVERIDLIGVPAGVYYIAVSGHAAATHNASYRLFINPPARQAPDDGLEGSGNDTIAQTLAQAEGAANSSNLGTVTAGKTLPTLKLNDTWDVYRFVLPANAPAFVHIDSKTPLDMILTDRDGNILKSAEAYQGQDSISFDGLAAGEYFVHVSHYALGEPGSFAYALNFG